MFNSKNLAWICTGATNICENWQSKLENKNEDKIEQTLQPLGVSAKFLFFLSYNLHDSK